MTKMILMLNLYLFFKMNFFHIIYILSFSLLLILIKMLKYNSLMALTSYTMVDNLSLILLSLTILSIILIFMSISLNTNNMNKLLLIMNILIMSFLLSKTMLFYISFEMVLIPTLLLITMKGNQPERLQAGMYLIMYTIIASLPLFIGIIFFQNCESMINFIILKKMINIPIIFMLAFLAKTPMFLIHLWLPKAHVEAPLEGSMILAAILLKLGGYGMIRFLPLIFKTMKSIPYWIMSISMMGMMYTSMLCIRQKDLKAMIAYSSVSHMAITLASIIIFMNFSINGAIIMMIAHGLSSSALFFLVNLTYTKFNTRNILSLKSNFKSNPNLTFWWFLFLMANISAPPSLNLMGEILMSMMLIKWHYLFMLILIMSTLFVTSFCILVFIMMNHGMPLINNCNHNETKFFLSLFTHLIFLIFLVSKMEFMLM